MNSHGVFAHIIQDCFIIIGAIITFVSDYRSFIPHKTAFTMYCLTLWSKAVPGK